MQSRTSPEHEEAAEYPFLRLLAVQLEHLFQMLLPGLPASAFLCSLTYMLLLAETSCLYPLCSVKPFFCKPESLLQEVQVSEACCRHPTHVAWATTPLLCCQQAYLSL